MKGDKQVWAILGVVTLLLLVAAFGGRPSQSPATLDSSEFDAADASLDSLEQTPIDSPEATGVSSDRVDATLLPQERARWNEDPQSSGWSEADQDFLREHGVSDAEARAAETILRENGVD